MTDPRTGPLATQLPEQLFFATAADRTALARERFFREGGRPTGLVSEPVIQSWQRCNAARRSPHERIGFDPVSASRQHHALQRGRPLLEAARGVLERLETALSHTGAHALLTDGHGIIVHRTPASAQAEPVLHLAGRVGVNLSESALGTTAPGVVLRTSQACSVTRGEHFFDICTALSCAAAPIRDRRGVLAGVLDLTVEGREFGFDAAAVAGLYAGAIENRLLSAPDGDCLVLCFQADPMLLDTPLQALAGVDSCGEVAWVNRAGRSLLGGSPVGQPAEVLFGLDLPRLLALGGVGAPARQVRLANGLTVLVRAQLQMERAASPAGAEPMGPAPAVGGDAGSPAAHPVEPATLADHDRRVVQEALARHGGNISRAARDLGVSRGLLYRRMAAWREAGPAA